MKDVLRIHIKTELEQILLRSFNQIKSDARHQQHFQDGFEQLDPALHTKHSL
ncbi:Uncharacterised protein [Vibrio cholerae]|nr:Uncharacterised protein [Vibrio cholerae]